MKHSVVGGEQQECGEDNDRSAFSWLVTSTEALSETVMKKNDDLSTLKKPLKPIIRQINWSLADQLGVKSQKKTDSTIIERLQEIDFFYDSCTNLRSVIVLR